MSGLTLALSGQSASIASARPAAAPR